MKYALLFILYIFIQICYFIWNASIFEKSFKDFYKDWDEYDTNYGD